MTPDEFARLGELVSDALLLLSGDGRILAANARAGQRLSSAGRPALTADALLADYVGDPPESTHDFLRSCRRSREDVVGAFRLVGEDEPTRVFGKLLAPGDDRARTTLLLRIASKDDPINRFAILNGKIAELGREIARRRSLEQELREQRDLAAFGRDIGAELARNTDLHTMLQRCAELLVQHLDSAFSRIWLVSANRAELELMASAGLYTHLDGGHSRIPIGKFKIGLIAERGEPHLTNAVIGDERVHDQEWARREGLISFAGYPLVVDRQTIGVMAIFARHELTADCLTAMESVANSIALGVIRKQSDVKLQKQARALQLADQRKDEFLAMLAHELRNPLAPIRSGLELLQLGQFEGDTVQLMSEQGLSPDATGRRPARRFPHHAGPH